MTRPGLYLHALRTARPRQLRGRLLRPLARRRFPAAAAARFEPVAGAAELWRSPAFAAAAPEGGSLDVLGRAVPYPPEDWSAPGLERLRRFHLHYGEEVLALAREGRVEEARAALATWIGGNPPRPGDAWHPYPLSTRAGSWIAALTLRPELAEPPVLASLARQLRHLEANVEEDVLGNHLIRNARALVLGGSALRDEALVDRGLGLLERELPEQVLPDGGHYERSPVYHLVVLRDLLEVRAATGEGGLDGTIARMRRFAAALARPDGAPALFNDGAFDLAPEVDLPPPEGGLSLCPETGYAVVRGGPLWLAFDCGPPAPRFLPAHAHADALSFQLWWAGEPVVVDPGTSTYEPGPDRDRERGTEAHATVAVDGDQFELWGAFRSGPLPRVELLDASERELVAAVEGRSGVRHVRRIELDGDGVRVEDRLEGGGEHAVVSSLPLAPGARPQVAAEGPLALTREDSTVAERLFRPRRAPALALRGRLRLPAVLGWRVGAGR